MSHFTVLVVGDGDIAEYMQPFHEYESTGFLDDFVAWHDVTDRVNEYWQTPQHLVKLANGSYHKRSDPAFYTKRSTDPLSAKLGKKEFELPAGAVELEVSANEAITLGMWHPTFKDAADDLFGKGVVVIDDRAFRLTNGDKWVWYSEKGEAVATTPIGTVLPGAVPVSAREFTLDPKSVTYLLLKALHETSHRLAKRKWLFPISMLALHTYTRMIVASLNESPQFASLNEEGLLALAKAHASLNINLAQAKDVPMRLTYRMSGARWDWYQVGGRWTGFFKLKPGKHGVQGRPGTGTEAAPAGYCDSALKGDIDFEQMRNDRAVKARHRWKTVREITGGSSWETWDDMCARYKGDIKLARNEYHEQPALVLLRQDKRNIGGFFIDDDLTLDEERFVQKERDDACVLFAYIKDGEWCAKGEALMFGMSDDHVSEEQWVSAFNNMLNSLPDDTMLTVVDFHT